MSERIYIGTADYAGAVNVYIVEQERGHGAERIWRPDGNALVGGSWHDLEAEGVQTQPWSERSMLGGAVSQPSFPHVELKLERSGIEVSYRVTSELVRHSVDIGGGRTPLEAAFGQLYRELATREAEAAFERAGELLDRVLKGHSR